MLGEPKREQSFLVHDLRQWLTSFFCELASNIEPSSLSFWSGLAAFPVGENRLIFVLISVGVFTSSGRPPVMSPEYDRIYHQRIERERVCMSTDIEHKVGTTASMLTFFSLFSLCPYTKGKHRLPPGLGRLIGCRRLCLFSLILPRHASVLLFSLLRHITTPRVHLERTRSDLLLRLRHHRKAETPPVHSSSTPDHSTVLSVDG